MKLETVVILTKGLCMAYIPFGTGLTAGLPELGIPAVFGIPVKVLTMIFASTVAGAGGLLAFLSNSFGSYMTDRKNGGAEPPKTV